MLNGRNKGKCLLFFCASAIEFIFDFLVDERFVVFEVLLDVHLELDDVVQDLFDLGVQFFAQDVGAEGQLFESRRRISILCVTFD